MAGPHSSNHGLRADGPPYIDPHPSQPIPSQSTYGGQLGSELTPLSAAYPGQLPPPVPYRKPRRRGLIIGVLISLGLVAALTAAIVYGARESQSTAGAPFTDAAVKTAIQNYLTALEDRDIDTISRNMLCGIYDAVRDRRSDRALAKLSSEAFRKQFAQAEVTSIDKIVYISNYQAQVLFTMRVKPTSGGQTRNQVQGLTQLLFQHGQILVCSYVLRTAGAY
jgi:hypothetical protein